MKEAETILVNELRAAADRLEQAERAAAEEREAAKAKPAQVVPDLPVTEAYNWLHDAGLRRFCIEMNVWHRDYERDHAEVIWQIWDGSNHFERPTLRKCVEAAIDAHEAKKLRPSTDLVAADAQLA